MNAEQIARLILHRYASPYAVAATQFQQERIVREATKDIEAEMKRAGEVNPQPALAVGQALAAS